MWFLLLWAIGLVAAGIDFLVTGSPKTISEVCTVLLLYQFVVTFGLVAIIGFFINVVIPEKTAKSLGWPGGPFQIKYGFSQLGLGIFGVMAIWFRGNFWVGVLLTMYIYGLSGLWSHSQIMIQNKKWDVGNVANIIMDILYQAFITILSIYAGGVWHI